MDDDLLVLENVVTLSEMLLQLGNDYAGILGKTVRCFVNIDDGLAKSQKDIIFGGIKEAVGSPNENVINNFNMEKFPKDVIENCTSAFCNKNLGVWARFAYAINADTEYICVFDDDTIPGKKWFENCLETMKTHRGLLGCRGVRMTGDDYSSYPGCQYVSFCANNPHHLGRPLRSKLVSVCSTIVSIFMQHPPILPKISVVPIS